MRIGNHNIMQLANGDWADYRVINDMRFIEYKTVYHKEEVEPTKKKLMKEMKRPMHIRAIHEGGYKWTIWYHFK
jgi:hypothetical protein